MPPWLPQAGYGEFTGERRLTAAQIQAIAEWARSGAPEGARPNHRPAMAPLSEWQLGPPDLIIQAPQAFRPPVDGPDLFWNFILSPSLRETRFVRAIEIRPGNTRVVHHANAVIDRSGSSRGQETAPGLGFAGMDLTFATDASTPTATFCSGSRAARPRSSPKAWHGGWTPATTWF